MSRAVAESKPLWDVMNMVRPGDGTLAPAAVAGVQKLCELIERYGNRAKQGSLVDVASGLVNEIRYQEELARVYKEPADQQARWAAVEDVINALSVYEQRAKKPTLVGFMDEIMLGTRENEQDKEAQLNRNAIALMTLHSAKGLEFPHVYLVGLEEGLLPHQRSIGEDEAGIDEERRLCYVGVTRARDRLTLSLSLSRMKWGKSRPTQPSRFLFEITGQADRVPKPAGISRTTGGKSSLDRSVARRPKGR
jgi:DNA helicase-2/ATP-dependent DNA helicase PcrA